MLTPLAHGVIALAAAISSTPPDHERPAQLDWAECPESAGIGDWPELGARLRCAQADMPLDHRQPDGRTVMVDIVRVLAADPARREGSIFFNIGGPGGYPGAALPSLAAGWLDPGPGGTPERDKQRLAERFDLVAVVPRGLGAAWRYDCLTPLQPTARFLPTHRDDANWQRTLDDARREAAACRDTLGARSINTEQHVRDMDHVRRAIGDERIHFYGISHGALVGAWYAATFPAHMGRMLLDSPFYFRHNYQTATVLSLEAERRLFERDILAPVIAAPAAYGLALEGDDIQPTLWRMPGELREAWHDRLVSPMHLATALAMQAWVAHDGWKGWVALSAMAERRPFARDPVLSASLRTAARQLLMPASAPGPMLPPYRFSAHHRAKRPAGVLIGAPSDSVWIATLCNDGPWWGTEAAIRARADHFALNFWEADGTDIAPYLVCSRWGGHAVDKPDMDVIATGPAFLMLQSEDDVPTPARGSEALLAYYPNAHLVMARGSDLHGLFNASGTPCIERAAARFLLTGELPNAPGRRTECRMDAVTP
ncbi:MAG TPA: alpha/beta fold hydrolase [Luteibacter sp.]|jgi:pimeloyl-ACP methyl ester carboxylesterase|uniref:alpha/beta fold hydrolase n=1 Tax=Luteibacter sp. TaxID=1886636 RepID=UPI002F3F742A